MVAREILVLFTILAATSAWLGDNACENIIQYGSREDVEQCFQTKFPGEVAEVFLRCAQNSHASRAYTVLQDYCQDDGFQDEINTCMNQDESITLVTQNVAFRTLRTCLDWISRSIPDESSESNEESGRALRKRDLNENEVDVDEKAPKEHENAEESPKNIEEHADEETVDVTEESIVLPTDKALDPVTEIISAFDVFTEANAEEETNEIGKDEEIGEDIGLNIQTVEPNEVVDENANDIPPEDIENTHSPADDVEEKYTKEEADENDTENKSEEVVEENDVVDYKDVEEDVEEDNEEVGGEDVDKDQVEDDDEEDNEEVSGEDVDEDQVEDDNEEDNEEVSGEDVNEVQVEYDDEEKEDVENDEEINSSEESDKDDNEEDKSSEESETYDDNSSASDESNSSSNDDSEEYDLNFDEYAYPFDYFLSEEVDRSHEIINARYNRINFAIYVNRK